MDTSHHSLHASLSLTRDRHGETACSHLFAPVHGSNVPCCIMMCLQTAKRALRTQVGSRNSRRRPAEKPMAHSVDQLILRQVIPSLSANYHEIPRDAPSYNRCIGRESNPGQLGAVSLPLSFCSKADNSCLQNHRQSLLFH